MRSAIILALTSSTLAMPFGNVIDTVFGSAHEARQEPPPGEMAGYPPIGTASGTDLPFPTVTGASPTASGGMSILPFPGGQPPVSTGLGINYGLAPTAVPNPNVNTVVKRQYASDASASLPSFSLEPTAGVPSSGPEATDSALPVPTDKPAYPLPSGSGSPAFPFPTGGLPFPSGGTGTPSLPTTLQTLTRGPQPTVAPGYGEGYSEEEASAGSGFWDWLAGSQN